jgi:hypothetical protein
MSYKKLIPLGVTLLLLLSFVLPMSLPSVTLADSGKDAEKIAKNKLRYPGDVAVTSPTSSTRFISLYNGVATYETTFAQQGVGSNLLPIDCTWTKSQDSSGQTIFTSGNNLMTVQVVKGKILVLDDKGLLYRWTSDFSAGEETLVSGQPQIVDDLFLGKLDGPSYYSNCLKWDYGTIKKNSGLEDFFLLKNDSAVISRYLRLTEGVIKEYWVIDRDPLTDIRLVVNDYQEKGMEGQISPMIAFDSSDPVASLIMTAEKGKKSSLYTISATEFAGKTFPVYIDPTLTYSHSMFEVLYRNGSDNYSTVHDYTSATTGTLPTLRSGVLFHYIGHSYTSGSTKYEIRRGFLSFDTSNLPDNANVSSSTITLMAYSDSSGGEEWLILPSNSVVYLDSNGNVYPHTPIQTGDYNRVNYTTFVGEKSIDLGISPGLTYAISLNSSGLNLISCNSTTSYSLRLLDERSSYPLPSIPFQGRRHIYISYSSPPSLSVTYSIPVVSSTITTDNSTSHLKDSANLVGTLTFDGNATCSVSFQYGTDNGTTSTSSTQSGVATGQTVTQSITGLSPGTKYFYRAKSVNSFGTSYGALRSFITKPEAVTGQNVTAGDGTNLIKWIPGSGQYQGYVTTYIRSSTVTCPATLSSGTFVYSGPGTPDAEVFTTNSNWTAPASVTSVNYLIVGGGGGASSGGGGAGGYVTGTVAVNGGGTYAIVVGAGGAGADPNGSRGGDGGESSFGGTIVALGGGGGGKWNQDANGASAGLNGSGGGGGSHADSGPPWYSQAGYGTLGQGFNGSSSGAHSGSFVSGGGGGAGSNPGQSTNWWGSTVGDYRPGIGINNAISGATVMYATGGAGTDSNDAGYPGVDGTDGRGNGGNGAYTAAHSPDGKGGDGGDGRVILENYYGAGPLYTIRSYTHSSLSAQTYYYALWSVYTDTSVTDSPTTEYSSDPVCANGTPWVNGPPTVVTQDATMVTQGEAYMNGELIASNMGSDEIDMFITWDLHTHNGGDYAYTEVATPPTANWNEIGQFWYYNSGLSPNTSYFYRAKAVGPGGTSYGAEKNFTTGALSAPSVTTDNATEVGLTSFNMKGTVTDDGGYTNGVTAHFDYGPSNSYGLESASYINISSGTPMSWALTNVTAGSTWHYRLSASNSAGSTNGGDKTVTTLPPSAPSVATGTSSAGSSTCLISGSVTNDGGTGCETRFEYGITDAYGSTTGWQSGKTTGVSFSSLLENLIIGQVYHYRAVIKNSTATTYGDDVSFTTIFTIPMNFSVKSTSSTSVSMSWIEGGENTLIMTREGTYPTDRTEGVEAYFGPDDSANYSDLSPGKTYFFSGWSQRPDGNSVVWTLTYATEAVTMPSVTESSEYVPEEFAPTLQQDTSLYQAENVTKYSSIPFYGMIEDAATDSGIPVQTLMFLVAIGLCLACAACASAMFGGNAWVFTGTALVSMWAVSLTTIIPWWVVLLSTILAVLFIIKFKGRGGG